MYVSALDCYAVWQGITNVVDWNNTHLLSPSGSGVQVALSWVLCSESPRLQATGQPELESIWDIESSLHLKRLSVAFPASQLWSSRCLLLQGPQERKSLLLEGLEDREALSLLTESARSPGQHPPFGVTQSQLIRDLDSVCKIPLPLPYNGPHPQVLATRRRTRWYGTYMPRGGSPGANLEFWPPHS